jgi:hypothetical protein
MDDLRELLREQLEVYKTTLKKERKLRQDVINEITTNPAVKLNSVKRSCEANCDHLEQIMA